MIFHHSGALDAAHSLMNRSLRLLAALAPVVLTGCAITSPNADRVLGLVTPYRIDVTQGNVVTQELAAQVKPGMTREQVRDVLGSPLLTSAFHADRWDYTFTLRRQGVPSQQRSVVAHFKDNVLERLEAADLPSEKEFVTSIRPARLRGAEPLLALSDDQRKALPPPVKTDSAAAPQPQGASRTYPPLEPQ
jgi:outer membrane protein assembly factor BamE